MSPEHGASAVLSIVFIVVLTLELLLAIMIIKTKRLKEGETVEKKRHADVLYCSVVCVDILGSCLIYPILIFVQRKSSDDICKTLLSAACFYMTCISLLTSFINIHAFYSVVRPFQYLIYLRTKHSKIPFVCVFLSVFIGAVSLVLSACNYPLFRLTPGFYFGLPHCIPELQQSDVIYYYVILIHITFWINMITSIHALSYLVSRRQFRKQSTTTKSGCCRLHSPQGAAFKMAFRLMYLVTWAPFMVITTMQVSKYSVSAEVTLTCCYVMLVPSLVSPFVFYTLHVDFRKVVNKSVKELYIKVKQNHHNTPRVVQSSVNQVMELEAKL